MNDHDFFNCSEQHEHDYVVRLYALSDRPTVREFLRKKCADGTIYYWTHKKLYNYIEEKLGLTRINKR